ncbi:MAG: NAD(P)(+) transhydrogenase (Re/Si-specific) subunit beta [Verrucomicrobia bacterium]|nr:NAD(P)(+) transhydrogenase (Re/Si-specific) subunit beta [Verrucomicrobiota bacterium]
MASAACFILALKWLSAVPTARRGVITGIVGMLLAVGGTLMLLTPEAQAHGWFHTYRWILVAFVVGAVIGVPMAMMPMTAVPQRTALSHAFGALAAGLVGTAEYYLRTPKIEGFTMGALGVEIILGFLTFTASLMAFGKLQEILPTRPIVYKMQNIVNLSVFTASVLIGAWLVVHPGHTGLFLLMIVLALAFGVMLIIPIGGADMPTVIALLNSYAGLSACAMGFVLDNKLLIVAGALDGSSGLILSIIMCKAMNRSFTNVLFGGFGQMQMSGKAEQRTVRSASPEEAVAFLEAANAVMVVPGYGMAVAQAQHRVRDLFDHLTARGVDVKFAIHPVAGRMPGHMNVLLAEAEIPYDKLIEMEDANVEMPQVDVALIIGANDVTNPAAREKKDSPIYGMPIIDVDKARTVMVIKRSLNPGFAGIENDLYYYGKTLMLFGDAKDFVGKMVKVLEGGAS